MTPLAKEITRQLALPKAKRKFDDYGNILKRWSEIHCFECSAVIKEVVHLMMDENISDENIYGYSGFLPFNRTFIEFAVNHADLNRFGYFLDRINETEASITAVEWYKDGRIGGLAFGRATLAQNFKDAKIWTCNPLPRNGLTNDDLVIEVSKAFALLSIINAPRSFIQQSHPVDAWTARQRLTGHRLGKYPLLAVSEIKLPQREMEEEARQRGIPAGDMPLHWVRKHWRKVFRRVDGRKEWSYSTLIPAHQRGDAANGIKQSYYTVHPPEGPRA